MRDEGGKKKPLFFSLLPPPSSPPPPPSSLPIPHPSEFPSRVADASPEDAATAGEGTASPARYAHGPGGTPAPGIAVPGGERPAAAGEHVGHHLHPGPRKGAGSGSQLTDRGPGPGNKPVNSRKNYGCNRWRLRPLRRAA